MHTLLEQLYQGRDLTKAEAKDLFDAVMGGDLEPVQIAAILVAMKIKGESPEEMAGAAQAMVKNARHFPRPMGIVADCVGTGGDGAHTINISTASAVLLASLGVSVAKHGSNSVTSLTGSAELLQAFGVKLDAEPELVSKAMTETGFGFLYAPVYHTAMRHAAPVRQALKTRTLFNILGPLANPAQPDYILLGVYKPELCRPMAEALRQLGYRHALVVHGAGTDELALHGENQVVELDGSEIKSYTLRAADFGLDEYPLSALVGGEPEENQVIIEQILAGKGTDAQNSALAINAGALLKLTGKAASYEQGAQMALAKLASGEALETLQRYAELTQG